MRGEEEDVEPKKNVAFGAMGANLAVTSLSPQSCSFVFLLIVSWLQSFETNSQPGPGSPINVSANNDRKENALALLLFPLSVGRWKRRRRRRGKGKGSYRAELTAGQMAGWKEKKRGCMQSQRVALYLQEPSR